jgi:hypothetical protein
MIAMNTSASIAPVLAAQPANDGTLRVRLAGDWPSMNPPGTGTPGNHLDPFVSQRCRVNSHLSNPK